jgi:Alpha/beta hydrolase domain containing 18
MRERYRRWIYDWESRLTSRDNNRVVRPFEWGPEWTNGWPIPEDLRIPQDQTDRAAMLEYWTAVNERAIANSDQFYAYKVPTDFRIEHRKVELFHTGSEAPKKLPKDDWGKFLRFTSAVESPYPENNCMNARWFPARGRRAVILLPQWNADGVSQNALCRLFNMLGIAALRMSMPYHDIRRPAGLTRADYAVSSNIGRTIHAGRQAIIDIRSCLDWLQERGYTRLGIVGTSLGSCYAFLAGAHDPRISVCVFNHASSTFGDVVWTGQSTQHIRQSLETVLTQDDVRRVWMSISPIVYFDKFERWPKKSLMIYGRYDLTFLPEFSMQAAGEFLRRGLDTTIKALPCGHYSLGETPYKYMDAWHISRFLAKAFAG